MNEEILLVESIIRVQDLNEGYIRCVETNIGMVIPIGPNDHPSKEFEVLFADVHEFSYFDKGEVKRFKMAWHPEFEKEIGIPLNTISEQSEEIEKLRMQRASLNVKIDAVINMSFFNRVKFLFSGSIE